jgi:hypothetical protein
VGIYPSGAIAADKPLTDLIVSLLMKEEFRTKEYEIAVRDLRDS